MCRVVLILLLSVHAVWCSFYIFRAVYSQFGNQSVFRGKFRFSDNIGHKDYSEFLSFPPIDAVYTWVNGSDPKWLQEKNYYEKLYNKRHNVTDDSDSDSATSDNRFRDNDELKCAFTDVFSVDTACARWK